METKLHPLILQMFNPKLLSTPAPRLRDWSGTFEYMWKEAMTLWGKIENNPQKKARCEKLKGEILELYERAKIKEKEREGQTNHKTQRFGYHIAISQGMARDIYTRLMFRRKSGCYREKFRKNYAFHKNGRKINKYE